jgi:hypothetical protein
MARAPAVASTGGAEVRDGAILALLFAADGRGLAQLGGSNSPLRSAMLLPASANAITLHSMPSWAMINMKVRPFSRQGTR